MSSRLEGTQCKGKSFKRGLSRHGHKHWLSYTRQWERCFAIAGLLLEQPKSPGTFFFTALFSAYLGATVTNMLSVVSSVLAKVFLPQRQIWTFCTFGHFPGLWGRTPNSENNSAKGRTGLGEGTRSAQGVGEVPTETGHFDHHFSSSEFVWTATAQPSTPLR